MMHFKPNCLLIYITVHKLGKKKDFSLDSIGENIEIS